MRKLSVRKLREIFGQTLSDSELKNLLRYMTIRDVFVATRLGWISCKKKTLMKMLELPTKVITPPECFYLCPTSARLMELAKENLSYKLNDDALEDPQLKQVLYAEVNNCIYLLDQEGLLKYEGERVQGKIPEKEYDPVELEASRLTREYVEQFSATKGALTPVWAMKVHQSKAMAALKKNSKKSSKTKVSAPIG